MIVISCTEITSQFMQPSHNKAIKQTRIKSWLEWIEFDDKYEILTPVFVTIALPFIFTYIFLNFNFIKELAQLGIFFTIAIAFLNYFSNQQTKRDEEITKQAILALERAYEILTTDNEKNTVLPCNNRLNWLTTAKMLIRYGELKKLKTDLYRTICEEQEEY